LLSSNLVPVAYVKQIQILIWTLKINLRNITCQGIFDLIIIMVLVVNICFSFLFD
jgi:hypothetical protein